MINSNKIIKGNLALIILRILYHNGWRYGYEVRQAVQAASGGKLMITEAALYTTLHQMEEAGWVNIKSETVDNRQRNYYKLNPKGRRAAEKELAAFEENVAVLRKVLRYRLP
jgi:DNA-binding PadR family transcriptional regulator